MPSVLALLPVFAGYSARPIGKTGTVAVSTSDPAGCRLLELRGGGCSLTVPESQDEGAATTAGGTIRMPAEAFARQAGGRLAAEHTPDGVTVEGALSLDDPRQVFPGY